MAIAAKKLADPPVRKKSRVWLLVTGANAADAKGAGGCGVRD